MPRQVVWTTKLVDEASEKISNGYVLKKIENPFFDGIVGLRRAGLTFRITQQEQEEYVKCALDIHYFAEQYCYVKGEDGQPIIIPLRDYQNEILDNFFNNRYNILMASRQVGKTICSSITMLHFALFNNNKNILITANKLDTAVEVLDKIREIYQRLPFFLQQGVTNWNQKFLVFENKSRIKGFATTKTSSIGQSADFLYLDEFAYLPDNIAEKFYKSVFPTISNIENSKIIITSTPNGFNLFHKLLTDAEKPEDEKSSYVAKRVYWWQVPKRIVTYVRLNPKKLSEFNISKEQVLEFIKNRFPNNNSEMKFDEELKKWTIHILNSDGCQEEDIIKEKIGEIKLLEISDITTWKKETIKNIGGEAAFNQEFDLRFIDSSRNLLSESLIDEINRSKEVYEWEEIDEIENKIKFSYKDLLWVQNEDIFLPIKRKEYKIIMSVDVSEGLGLDYSVINIFKITNKSPELINSQKESYKSITDFFKLEQIGIFRSNIVSVEQLSEILYLIAFEYFNPDNVKIVLEINTYGNELIAHMPHVFEGNNNYGSSIFFRYKHRIDATEEKIGIKVGENKNLLVKDYQDKMQDKSVSVTNEKNILELTTFIKHVTSAGNIRYAADGSSNDDTVMTVVHACSVFKKEIFKQMIEEIQIDAEVSALINEILNKMDHIESIDYGQVLRIRKKNMFSNKMRKESMDNTNSWINQFKRPS